jgi:hypothetical protein
MLMFADKVGGWVKKDQKYADLILEWFLVYNDIFRIQNNKNTQNISWDFKKIVQRFTNFVLISAKHSAQPKTRLRTIFSYHGNNMHTS